MNTAFVMVTLLVIGAQAAPVFVAKPGGLRSITQKKVDGKGSNQTGAQAGPALECGVTSQVDASSDKHQLCPTTCPFFAQNRKDTQVCTFLCVPATDCPKWNAKKPIPDTIQGTRACRGPRVDFCANTALDGTDSCIKCQAGFALDVGSGQCHFHHWPAIFIASMIAVALVVVLTVWVIDLCMRETNNEAELIRAQNFRSRSKILQPKNIDGHRHPFPLTTNLCTTDVAGIGMMLHFNFQAFCIAWPLVIALFWGLLACFHEDLWVLGTKKFGTPRHNCILVAWGYETQQKLMWTKVLFLAMTYLFSFIAFMLFSVRQYRIYQEFEAKEKTMKKFALELQGLPELAGRPSLEKEIQTAVETATGQGVVGVSIAWHFGDNEEAIMKAVANNQTERELQMGSLRATEDQDPTANFGPIRKKMYSAEKYIFTDPEEEADATLAGVSNEDRDKIVDSDLTKMLAEMLTSDTAFVVFKSSEDAAKALEKTAEAGVLFNESTLSLAPVTVEPTTINWQNFGDPSCRAMVWRMLKGLLTFYIPALCVWFFVFYVPYAVSCYNFNYDNGAELPGYYGLVFTMIVVGGNAAMYVVCDIVSERIGFRYKDTKQCMYMLMYLFACSINVLLDMSVTYFTALKIMIGLDFRTYDGTRLEHIEAFTDQFETYAMQRSLGGNTFAYAWPSTFLIPFLIEPIVTVLVPYQLGRLIIRTHSEVNGICAESWIAAFDFDLGRYADILLNIFLGILIFFFPGGYNWTLFCGMFASHIVIYLFDHWRVLNVIPTIKITTYQVDWWAQVMLGGCCAIIMGVLVFKANCEPYAGYCIKDMKLISATFLAGISHFVVHMLLLIYLVPKLGKEVKDAKPGLQYEEIAANEAYSWFSVNPVHCLRSKLIHKHKPHCRFVSVGKEHLLEVNKDIGCHFFDVPADTEDSTAPTASGVWAALRKSLTGNKE